MRTDTGKVFVKLAKFRFALALVTLRKWSTELSLHKRKGFRFSALFLCSYGAVLKPYNFVRYL